MSSTIISLIVMGLAALLPAWGINLGTEQITPWVETTLIIVSGAVAWIRHIALKKQAFGASNVNAFGGVKK